MFTDIVGYTTLGQRNEDLALALLKEHRSLVRPILGRHEGREVKTIGDAFLADFPNALDAVRCAYEIQRATREHNFSEPEHRRIHLRIGVHLGDIVESGGDISGDAVNVASRIEPLAEADGVVISRQVRDSVRGKFELPLVGIGEKSLKNVTIAIEIFKMEMPWEVEASHSLSKLDERRVAVLPFASMSPDPNDEFFADGLTEELIDKLCKIKDFEVIARTSAMSYKKKDKKAGEIGRELGAGSLVEGSVRKAGNRIRVTAQLVSSENEGHIWSSTYDRNLDDIFAVQSDIAERVADALRVNLLPMVRQAVEKKPTSNKEAYVMYMKGRYHWNERTKESLDKAILYFKKAIEVDGNFALAYTGLADSYTILLDRGFVTSAEAMGLARDSASKALAIDESLAEAHVSLGGVYQHTFEWSLAESEFKRALELNPSLSRAHHWLAVNHSVLDHWNESVDELKKALELDPLSKLIMAIAAYDTIIAGRIDEGMSQAEKVVSEYPDEYWGHLALSLACFRMSLKERAIDEAEKGFTTGKGQPWPTAFYLYMLRKTGGIDKAKEVAERYLATDGIRPWNPAQLAMVFLSIDDYDRAFELLNRAYATSDPGLIYLGWPPVFDSVRSDPRYLDLLRKVKPTNSADFGSRT